jgi:hypothetical protein
MLLVALGLQVAQQIFYLVLALHGGESLLKLRLAQLSSILTRACVGDEKCVLGAASRSRLIDAAAHARHGGGCTRPGTGQLLAGAGTAVFHCEQFAARLRFLQPLLQPAERGAQCAGLSPLIGELLGEASSHLLVADLLAQRSACEVILLPGDGERRLALPVAGGFFVLRLLLFEQVLIGKRDGDLRLYLQELVLHIEDELAQHLLRIFRAVDQIVEIGAKQSCNSFKQCHDVTPLLFDAG